MHSYELPIWDDCPFRSEVPTHITIRRGLVDGIDRIAFDDTETGRGADVAVEVFEASLLPLILENIKPIESHEERMRQIKAKYQELRG